MGKTSFSDNYKQTVLLLTSCINPKGMKYTALQDIEERKEQYIKALKWYLNNTNVNIVFVENSGYDISNTFINYINDNRLEYLTFNGNDFDRTLGKGYGEALILEHAIKNSVFIRDSNIIVKITGRIICDNINKVINKYTNKNTIYGRISIDTLEKMQFSSRVVVAPYLFWQSSFLPLKEKINDSKNVFFEHVLYEAMLHWRRKGNRFKEMWFPLEMRGISGTTGKSFNSSSVRNVILFYWVYILHRCGYYGHLKFWK